jgi:hypothetical protein
MDGVDMDPVEICNRQEQLKTVRSTVEAVWNDVEKYVNPLRVGNMYSKDIGELSVT